MSIRRVITRATPANGLCSAHHVIPLLSGLANPRIRRGFVNQAPEPTVVTASRLLPFPAFPIFELVADVQSYSKFLPFIQASHVIKESPREDACHGKRWPALATLKVGFQDSVSETYTSRVFCVPPVPHKGRAGMGFVEAISGSEAPEPSFTTDEDVGHYDVGRELVGGPDRAEGPLAYLRTRWTIGEFPHKPAPSTSNEVHAANLEPEVKPGQRTNVHLAVEFRFKSPIYELMSKAATPRVADMMIEAFEMRAKELLGPECAK